jgi:hypothetical protein
MRLSDSGQARVTSEYTKAAYGLFPRYRLDEAIEIEVERLTGQELREQEQGDRGCENHNDSLVLQQVKSPIVRYL